jgi:hypothetical protein
MRDKLRKTPEILFEPKTNSLNLKKLPQGVTATLTTFNKIDRVNLQVIIQHMTLSIILIVVAEL